VDSSTEIDPTRIGVFGISFGADGRVMLHGARPARRRAVAAMAGPANLAH